MKDSTANWLLALGAGVGIALATYSLVEGVPQSSDWVATIDGEPIPRQRYDLQIDALTRDKRGSLADGDRAFVLERIIEEELLIRRGLDLGLLQSNNLVRGTLVQQMIQSIKDDAALNIPDETELREFYTDNLDWFVPADQLRLKMLAFVGDAEQAGERAVAAFGRLSAGESLAQVEAMADSLPLRVPNALLPLAKLREYIGPTLLVAATRLGVGEISPPQTVPGGYRILVVLERRDAVPRPFEQVRQAVLVEFEKRRDDQALRDYLDNLKNWYDVDRSKAL